MSDKELEIRHQFLDEAQDYLDNLENSLIGLASGGANAQAINSAMRSAHSIKGGAGMMGFQLLSQLSHRLEDGLKVLKIQKHAVDINAELEQLLLSAVDCLRRVAESDRQNVPVDPSWLDRQVLPLFDQLHERLGDPQEEDAASILSPEENQDILPLLFQTEVEGCLQRLEGVLEGDRHCLYEETEILAQELGALGEMLQLSAFSQLCNAVLTTVQARPDQIESIARAALTAWRQTQLMVLAGNYSNLPTTLALDIGDVGNLDESNEQALPELEPVDRVEDFGSLEADVVEVSVADSDWADADLIVPGLIDPDFTDPDLTNPDFTDPDPAHADSADADLANSEWAESNGADLDAAEPSATADAELDETDLDLAGFGSDISITDQSWADAIAQAEMAGDSELFDEWPVGDGDDAIVSPEWSNEDVEDSEFDLDSSPDLHTFVPSFDADIDPADSVLLDADADITAVEDGHQPINRGAKADYSGEPEVFTSDLDSGLDSDLDRVFASGVDDSLRPDPAVIDNGGGFDYGQETTPKPPKQVDATPRQSPAAKQASDDATVRVPLKQLKQLNNLFGELTIERNGLELYLKRLRDLLSTLRTRVKILDQTNLNLRSAYDRVTTRAALEQSTLAIAPQLLRPQSKRPKAAVNRLTEAFDALELDQYSDMHLMSQEVMETIVQIQEVTTDLELSMDDTDQMFRGLNKTAKQLQTRLTQLQMRPLSDILERFPRALRKMSLEHGKSAELKVNGGNILIDRNILEALNEPLLHLLRNAFDHGIEDPDTRQANGKPAQGTIEISAIHRNNRTLISIRDDGKGVNLEKIRARARQMGLDDTLLAAASDDELISLIFEPGFSTSNNVTDLSGRGVGMDVVRDSIKQLQGEISVDTAANQGTTFTLSLPFTLSVTRVLLVESNDLMMAFPTDAVEEMTSVSSEQVMKTIGGEVIDWEEQMVQFIRLHQWLRFNCPRSLERPSGIANIEESTVLMVTHNEHLVGLQVGRCWGEQEVAIRYVEGSLPMPHGFSTCTILGDGRVVPMVNVSELLRWIMSDERSRPAPAQTAMLPVGQGLAPLPAAQEPAPLAPKSHKPAILIVDDSINVRRFLALTLEKAGYRVEQAKDGQDAVDKLTAGLPVQAVICDIEMPRLDGYGVLARVKSNSALSHLPIAMLTSRSGDKHRKLAMSLGASAYFSKPYNEQVLLQTLRQIVESAVVA
ncbi:MAG: response regulator [Elainellaceae cyanobacterium]